MLWILEVLPEGLEFDDTCQNSSVLIRSCLVIHVTILYFHSFIFINYCIFIPLTSQLHSAETIPDIKPHLVLMPLKVILSSFIFFFETTRCLSILFLLISVCTQKFFNNKLFCM